MGVTYGRGHVAMADATACIVATNENLHIRGQVGAELAAVGGPIVQNSGHLMAPKKLGTSWFLQPGATPYTHIIAAVAFPFEPAEIDWGTVESTLHDAVKKAVSAGHTKIAIPFFNDAHWGAPDLVEPRCLNATRKVVEQFPNVDFVILGINDRQVKLLERAFGEAEVEQKLLLPVVEGEPETPKPEEKEYKPKNRATNRRRGAANDE